MHIAMLYIYVDGCGYKHNIERIYHIPYKPHIPRIK